MDDISIGLMIPTSGIRPMGKHFDRSFRQALNQGLSDTDFEVEVITEMIGNGNPVLIEQVLDKFFGFHDVKLVSGLVTSKAIEQSADRFHKRQVPLLMNNIGEHLIPSQVFNEHVIVNSIHLWQQCMFLGQYAAKELGKKGLIISAMFDGGYAFLNGFQMGADMTDNGCQPELKLLPLPEVGQLSNIPEAFENVQMDQYDFVFALFCGEEATQFIEMFYQKGLHKKTKLLGLPFLLELQSNSLAGLEILSVASSSLETDLRMTDLFKRLGTESGTAAARTILNGGGSIKADTLREALEINDNDRIYESNNIPRLIGEQFIVSHLVSDDNVVRSEIIERDSLDILNNQALKVSRDGLASSWMNSYLAV